jgi:hypothetical protein
MGVLHFLFADELMSLSYHPVDMGLVRQAVSSWETKNPKPTPPKKTRRWTGVDTAEWIRLSIERYGVQRHPDVRTEMEASFEETDDLTHPPYLAEVELWSAKRDAKEMFELVRLGCPDGQGEALAVALASQDVWLALRRAIVNCSELTDENVASAVIGLNRYFRGKPLVSMWIEYCERNGLTQQYEQSDSWDNRARDYLIQEGELRYVREYEKLPIEEQAVQIAWIITRRMIDKLASEESDNLFQN